MYAIDDLWQFLVNVNSGIIDRNGNEDTSALRAELVKLVYMLGRARSRKTPIDADVFLIQSGKCRDGFIPLINGGYIPVGESPTETAEFLGQFDKLRDKAASYLRMQNTLASSQAILITRGVHKQETAAFKLAGLVANELLDTGHRVVLLTIPSENGNLNSLIRLGRGEITLELCETFLSQDDERVDNFIKSYIEREPVSYWIHLDFHNTSEHVLNSKGKSPDDFTIGFAHDEILNVRRENEIFLCPYRKLPKSFAIEVPAVYTEIKGQIGAYLQKAEKLLAGTRWANYAKMVDMENTIQKGLLGETIVHHIVAFLSKLSKSVGREILPYFNNLIFKEIHIVTDFSHLARNPCNVLDPVPVGRLGYLVKVGTDPHAFHPWEEKVDTYLVNINEAWSQKINPQF